MSPGAKQSLVIAGFGALLFAVVWMRGRAPQMATETATDNNTVSFPVPSSVSPFQSPLFASSFAAPYTAADTRRYIAPSPLQTPQPRNNSSADNAGCCGGCALPAAINYPVALSIPAFNPPTISKPALVSVVENISQNYQNVVPSPGTIYHGFSQSEINRMERQALVPNWRYQ